MTAEQLRSLCLSMAGVTETLQWGNNRVFKVGGKIFAVTGYEADSLYSFKVPDERFLELSDLPGMKPAPYFARLRWVQVNADECPLPDSEIEQLVREGYAAVFSKLSKKLQREIGSPEAT